MTRWSVFVALAVVGLGATHAGAWWRAGHEHIAEGAVSHLPAELQGFFQEYLDRVKTYSGDEPPRPPQHYIDIDQYPDWPNTPIIRDLPLAKSTYGEAFVEDAGTAPWAVADHTAQLSDQMLAANTPQDWLDLLVTAGELAHYIEDLHNPLHLTQYYQGDSPDNYGIHQRYEGYMIAAYLDQLTIVASPADCQHQPAMLDTIFDSIEGNGEPGNYFLYDDILAADDLGHAVDPGEGVQYYAALWANTGDFTQVLFQEASEMVASAWYTAWVNAGSPMPILCPCGDINGSGGLVDLDDFATFATCFALTGPALDCDAFEFACSDMTGNGMVNLDDFATFAVMFATVPTTTVPNCVPEAWLPALG